MQDVAHNNLMVSAISWQLKPQSHVSISVGLAYDPSNKVKNLPLFSLGILWVPFDHLPISANVSSHGTI
jgi:hypothetical protein